MDGNRILLHELAILVIWLCAPTLIMAVLAQLWWFRQMRAFQGGHAGRAVIGLVGTVVLTPIVSLVLWMVLPGALLPGSVMPEGRVPIPPVFVPGIVAGFILAPLFAWWAVRARSS
jgi:hypothetical protein